MSRKLEIMLEKKIVMKLICALFKAGFYISVPVSDDETEEFITNKDKRRLIDEIFAGDWTLIYIFKPDNLKRHYGVVKLIPGNVESIICDYTINLEEWISPISEYCQTF